MATVAGTATGATASTAIIARSLFTSSDLGVLSTAQIRGEIVSQLDGVGSAAGLAASVQLIDSIVGVGPVLSVLTHRSCCRVVLIVLRHEVAELIVESAWELGSRPDKLLGNAHCFEVFSFRFCFEFGFEILI